MKRGISLILIAVFFSGCDLLTSSSGEKQDLNPGFTLTDTLGRNTGHFHPGENFDVSFSLRNTTGDTLTYYHTGPAVVFSIMKGDSIVATSIDGYLFPQVVIGTRLAPGDTLQAKWRAPNTPARPDTLVLAPGLYEATVRFPTFQQLKTDTISPIGFWIVQ